LQEYLVHGIFILIRWEERDGNPRNGMVTMRKKRSSTSNKFVQDTIKKRKKKRYRGSMNHLRKGVTEEVNEQLSNNSLHLYLLSEF